MWACCCSNGQSYPATTRMDSRFGDIGRERLTELLNYFSRKTFKATDVDAEANFIQDKCVELFARDYKCSIISNKDGVLCSHYPSKIVICHCRTLEEIDDDVVSPQSLSELFSKSRAARCRSRFVVPVILFDGKNICRSATLSSAPEIYGRSGYDFFFSGKNDGKNGKSTPALDEEKETDENNESENEWDLFNRIRGRDVSLLRKLAVRYIYDLMVERKKVKFGMNITSSEKVDKEKRYAEFTISSVPYPGCEFFRDYKNNCYSGEGIYFDWSQTFVDANLNIPANMPMPSDIDWKLYKNWDLVTLTQNYILFVLKLLKDGDGGVLIHCISGWDRTPLFISLIRLSLWADGRIHQSLSPSEILYLTIGYDWLLFGHDLEDRLTKGEEVFFFCFNFLKHIVSDDFSINITRSSSLPSLAKPRAESLSQLDGQVLLLDDHRRLGSCTSLNSQHSTHSERIHHDGQTIDEIVDDSSLSSNGSFTSLNAIQTHSSWSSSMRSLRHTANSPPVISTPVPVPTQARQSQSASTPGEQRSSFCGSWQIISDAGSPRGTTTMRDVPTTVGRSSSSSSLCEANEESLRQQKLEAVRSLFLNSYACSVGYRGDQSQGLFDNVATRMLKGTWMSTV